MKFRMFRVIFKTIAMIAMFFTISLSACSCGGDTGSTDPDEGSGDGSIGFFDDSSGEEPEEISDGINGEITGIEISATSDQLTMSATIYDIDSDEVTDSSEELIIRTNNYSYISAQDEDLTYFSLTLSIDQEGLDITEIEIGKSYDVDTSDSKIYIRENAEASLNKYYVAGGTITFLQYGLPEDQAAAEYEFELEFDDGGSLSGHLSTELDFEDAVSPD